MIVADRARENRNGTDWVAEELVSPAIDLFSGLFDHCPLPHDAGYRIDYIGEREISLGVPDPLPSNDILESLRQLKLPEAIYQPDGEEPITELVIAINVKGSILFATWLRSGYGDDIQPNHRNLEHLLVRYTGEGPDTLPQIRSLSARVAAELAFQRGDYATALSRIADSIYCVYDVPIGPIHVPWLSAVKARAEICFEHLEQSRGGNTDWPEVVKACEKLSKCSFSSYTDQGMHPDERVDTISDFWLEKMGWAQAQLTPDQIRDHLKEREDESAVQRLRTYFFADELWGKLSRRAQEALVSADRALVTGTQSRHAAILNEIRIASEEILNEYVWEPLNTWAVKQQDYLDSPFSGIRRARELFRVRGDRAPNLGEYADLVLKDVGTTRFLRNELRIVKKDEEFIKQRVPKFLKRLRDTRNPGEHQLGHDPEPATIHEVYAESLGIGREGMLPELVRLLATRRTGSGRFPAEGPPAHS